MQTVARSGVRRRHVEVKRFALVMLCVNGHEFDGDPASRCPACSEPSQALIADVRRECTADLRWAVPYAVVPPATALFMAASGSLPMTAEGLLLSVIMTLLWLSGMAEVLAVIVGAIRPLTEARARVGTPPKLTMPRS